MKKIEPALSQYRRNKDGVASRWITTSSPDLIAEFGYEVRQLYTREALEAVAEAVHKKTMHQFHMHIMSGDECEMPERINLDAIINQLTGE